MDILSCLENLNWQTILGMFAIGWYFTHDIRKMLEKLEIDVKAQGARTDKLYEMFIDLLKDRSK